jgi:hypothetical protein
LVLTVYLLRYSEIFILRQVREYGILWDMKKEDLIGKWKISREIVGMDGSSKGRMWGSGVFDIHEGNQLLYQEMLYHETEKDDLLLAKKFYRYHFKPDVISIYFYKEEEGRLFLELPISPGEMKGSSMCRNDCYTLAWNWINPEKFLTRYSISGPSKSMIIESEFSR